MRDDPELHRVARRFFRDAFLVTAALVVAVLYPRSDDDEAKPASASQHGTIAPDARTTQGAAPAAPSEAPTQGPAQPAASPEPRADDPPAVDEGPTAEGHPPRPSEAPTNDSAARDALRKDTDTDAQQKRGFLSVSAVPWAEVRVDGRLLGSTPRRSVPLRPGKHTVDLSCPPLARNASVTVEIEPERELRVEANMHESPAEVTTR